METVKSAFKTKRWKQLTADCPEGKSGQFYVEGANLSALDGRTESRFDDVLLVETLRLDVKIDLHHRDFLCPPEV